eukprot:gene17740-biopygen4281
MVVKSSGGLRGPLADFGWRTLADWRTSGGLLADWRTSVGLLADRVSLPATPREGHNSSVSSVSQSVSSVFLPLHAREGLPGGLLADILADFGGLWRTSGGLAGGLWRTDGLGSPLADLTTVLWAS